MNDSLSQTAKSEIRIRRTSADWIDRFESDLRKHRATNPSFYFPEPQHAEFVLIVSEILRILLEWRWSNGERGGLDELLRDENLAWVRHNLQILAPVAFEDYRLRKTGGANVDREHYRQRFHVDVSQWERWLENPNLDSRGDFSSTISGNGETVSQSRSHDEVPSSEESGTELGVRRTAHAVLPEVGAKIGDFELVYQIGSGAFSRVFVGRQISLANRQIVLKITTAPLGESQQLARLQHGNIMPLYFAQPIHGLYVLGMPLLGLVTLKEAIDCRFKPNGSETNGNCRHGRAIMNLVSRKPDFISDPRSDIDSSDRNQELAAELLALNFSALTWEESILAIAQRLADGLQYSHSRGVQHRDIKPANILLAFDGQPMLLDFNLSRLESGHTNHQTRAVGGTLPYMSPEHLESMETGRDRFTRASDVYSLGVVMYEALTGKLPHDVSMFSSSSLSVAIETRRQAIKHPRALNPDIQPATASIVLKCLEHDPAKRYKSAQELATDLRLQLADRPLRFAANSSWLERGSKFWRRNSRRFSVASLTAFAVIMAVVAVAAGLAWRDSRQTAFANKQYRDFVKKSHLAEAELFFADGGSRERGRRLAEDALAVFDLNATQRDLSSHTINWLGPMEREEVIATTQLLSKLASADSVNLAWDKRNVDSATPLEQASDAYVSRDYLKAITILDRESEKSLERFAVWFLKGKCHFELREYRDAERCFAFAALVDPDSTMTSIARGSCLFFMSQFQDAERFFESARQRDPSNFTALYNLALVKEQQGELGAALAWLDKAEVVQPESTRAKMARHRIARAMGNEPLARNALDHVLAMEPTEPEGWILRGLARLPQSPSDAASDFAKAQEFSTTRFVAGQNRAHVLSEYLKKPMDAIDVLSELLEEDPNFLPALSGRAVLHARNGNREAALADVQTCQKLSLTPQLHYQIACVYALLAADDDRLQQLALHHLAMATAPAYGAHVIASDADLRNLERSSEFRSLRNGIRTGTKLQRALDSPQ
ncbi:MAG: protein kinase [Planctomycetaceae bacterium]|nr:protein kinase [Planctomycetaceae bacterium]